MFRGVVWQKYTPKIYLSTTTPNAYLNFEY